MNRERPIITHPRAWRVGPSTLRRTLSIMLLLGSTGSGLFAQPFVIGNGQDNTCQGAFLDSGGQGATGYDNDEDITYTLCPTIAGALTSVTFVTFQLSSAGTAPLDNLTIHDGNSTAEGILGTYSGGALQGQTISATAGNASGCLTFVWHSNETGTGVFAGTIQCTEPCVAPVAAALMGEPAPARICPGEVVTFNGSGSSSPVGNAITTWAWDFNDGNTATANTPNSAHAFNSAGVHRVQLTVTDNNGCQSTNRLDLQVHVGTEPSFEGTDGELFGCIGEELCLNGVVTPTPFLDEPETTYGDGIFIPDDVGSCFEAELYLTQFAAGATLTNIGQLLSLCMNFEHTWLGDLVITITSPSGQSVILHQQDITSEVLMGDPIDNDENNPQAGECATYCFANTSGNGTMAQAANGGGGGGPSTLTPATYQSLYPLAGLVGSELNGLWTLTVCDLWAQDNGFLCDWSLDFDPSLYSNIIGYVPNIGAGCDSTWWTGPAIISNTPDCHTACVQHSDVGNFNYVFHARDDFGCAFDTTLTVSISGPIVASAGPDQSICQGSAVALVGTVVSGGSPQLPFVYSWSPAAGLSNTSIATPLAQPADTVAYTLSISQAGHPGCAGSDMVMVNLVPLLQAGYNGAISVCTSDEAVDLFSVLGGDPDAGGQWTSPTGTPHSGSLQPSTAAIGPYTYTLSQMAPCPGSDQSIVQVSVVVPPEAGINAQTAVCSDGESTELFPILAGSPDPGGTWRGPSGDPVPSSYLPGSSLPGQYRYIVNGIAPCANDTSAVLVIQHEPVSAGTDGGSTLCIHDEPLMLDDLLGGSPTGGGAWSRVGGGSWVGAFDPALDTPGVYQYLVLGTAPCPNDTALITMQVDEPTVELDQATGATCADTCDAAAVVVLTSGTAPYEVVWSTGQSDVSSLGGLCAGPMWVAVTDALGCRDTVRFELDEPARLTIDALSVADERCVGNCDGMLRIADPEGAWFSWDGGNTWGTADQATGLCPGPYAVVMRDAAGCQATANEEVQAATPIEAEFAQPRDTVNVTDTEVEFRNLSTNATTFLWDFGGTATSQEENPVFHFPDVLSGAYEVCLLAGNANGCRDSICHPLIVLDELYLLVPNAFTPNDDRINDDFFPVMNIPGYASEYEFLIFDRWGELLFASTQPGQAWTGEYGGQPVPSDVYVWKLHCTDDVTLKDIDLFGHVTVVR